MKAVGMYIFAGGFTAGVKAAGFDVLAHLEGVGYGVSSAKLNWPDLPIYVGAENWPLNEILAADGGVDLVYCNPPCAIFSSMGIATTKGKGAWRTDPRTNCWHECFHASLRLRPRVFAIESVCQAYTTGREMIDAMTRQALAAGYSVTHLFTDAKFLGLPQSRKRFFFVAHRAVRFVPETLDFSRVPTIGEVLARVPEPGPVAKTPARLLELAAASGPGERLASAWDRANPAETHVLNARGHRVGRPSFGDRKLPLDRPSGAFIGDKFWHPTEARKLGFAEMKAICGYPADFRLDGPVSGYASLLARAVMPNVGEYLARSAALTIDVAGDEADAWPRTVYKIDLRAPDLEPVNLTSLYTGAGALARGETVAVPASLAVPLDEISAGRRPVGQVAHAIAVSNAETRAVSGYLRPVVELNSVDHPFRDVCVDLTQDRGPQPEESLAAAFQTLLGAVNALGERILREIEMRPVAAPLEVSTETTKTVGDVSITTKATTRVVVVPDVATAACEDPPAAAEGSGKYIQRLLLAGLGPDEILERVHRYFAGRKTKKSDVYYNHRKLIETFGEANVPKWPSAKRAPRSPKKTAAPTETAEPAVAPRAPRASSTNPDRLVVTGFTRAQALPRERTVGQKIDVPAALVAELERRGAEVDWSPGVLGEDRAPFAAALVCLGPILTLPGCQYAAQALMTISRAVEIGAPVVLFYDDWRVAQMQKYLRYAVENGFEAGPVAKRLLTYGRDVAPEALARVADRLRAVAEALVGGWHPSWTALFPRFSGWGDPVSARALVPTTRFLDVDPTPVVIDLGMRTRWVGNYPARAWFLASVADHRRWVEKELRPTWPVDYAGHRKTGERLATERDVAVATAARWGTLAPPYEHAGSGWFRSRYVYAALAETVMYASGSDRNALGGPFVLEFEKVEAATNEELRDLGHAQATHLFARISTSRLAFEAQVDGLVRAVGR